MSVDAKEYYKDYWVNADSTRAKRRYYERLYARVFQKLLPAEGARVLDVAGGNGQLMSYLGVKNADILDISESGLAESRAKGFGAISADVESRFPVEPGTYDAAYLFEVLEHLRRPGKTLSEVHHALKPGGALYVGQPNMRADGVHHVRRYYLRPLLSDLEKAGFKTEWVDFVPAYSMRDAIESDIRKNRSYLRKVIQCVNWCLSLLPWGIRHAMARMVPDRFALLFIIKATRA